MITIKQIADNLGVSPTTVSNVINGRVDRMSPDTREKIEQALFENHYSFHTRSNKVSSGENMIVAGLCMAWDKNILMDPFCGELIGSVERELKVNDKYMIYSTPQTEEEILRLFAPWNVEGGILLGYKPKLCLDIQRKIGKPVIFIDSFFQEGKAEYDNVGLQDYEGAYELTSYMAKQGHRVMAFFCDQNPPQASSRERQRGMQRAMEEYHLAFEEEDTYFLPEDKNLRHETLRQFVRTMKKEYTAAFFVSDFFANEAISIFYSQGLSVPEGISVAGFDDNMYARLSRPQLTTVRQSPAEKGRAAVSLLMKRIKGEESPLRTIQLPTELIVRESIKNRFESSGY